MKYRIGKKQKRALLDSNGNTVVVFEKGKEDLAERVCMLLNKDSKEQSNTPIVQNFKKGDLIRYKDGCVLLCLDSADKRGAVSGIMIIDSQKESNNAYKYSHLWFIEEHCQVITGSERHDILFNILGLKTKQ